MTEKLTALRKGIRVLKELADRPHATLTELAEAQMESTSTTDRILRDLEAEGLAERLPGGAWCLGKAAATLWSRYRTTQEEVVRRATKNLQATNCPGARVLPLPGTFPVEWN